MKKLFAAAILAIASSFAFASDLSLANYNPPQKVEAITVAVASQAPAPAVVQDVPVADLSNNIQQGAAKLGSLLGGVFKTAVDTGKAFTNGVSNGMNDKPSGKSAATAPKSQDVVAPAAAPTATGSGVSKLASAVPAFNFAPLSMAVAMIQKAKEDRAAATPVEDRSSVASSTDY